MTLPSTLMRGSDLKRAAKAIASVASASGIRLRRAGGHSCSILAAAPPIQAELRRLADCYACRRMRDSFFETA
jgi:hypothetical protein